jgi:hypothetical protein
MTEKPEGIQAESLIPGLQTTINNTSLRRHLLSANPNLYPPDIQANHLAKGQVLPKTLAKTKADTCGNQYIVLLHARYRVA